MFRADSLVSKTRKEAHWKGLRALVGLSGARTSWKVQCFSHYMQSIDLQGCFGVTDKVLILQHACYIISPR